MNYLDPLLKLVSILSPTLQLWHSGDGYFPMRFWESHIFRHLLYDSHHLLERAVRIGEGSISIAIGTILYRMCSIFLSSSFSRILLDGHPTGLTVFLHREKIHELLHSVQTGFESIEILLIRWLDDGLQCFEHFRRIKSHRPHDPRLFS